MSIGARIPHTARREAAYREIGALIDAERLATNLLSSMPLTFNLLAPWGHTPQRASGYLRELLPAFTGSAQEGLQQPISKVMPCRPPIGTVFLTVDARAAPRPFYHATYPTLRGCRRRMRTNEQLLNEITAAMADTWLAACDRRVIAQTSTGFVVLDLREKVGLFGPAPADECRVFIHRSAALDVLRMIGTARVAEAATVAAANDGQLPATLNG